MDKKRKIRISFNSPVILTFSALCCAVLFLEYMTKNKAAVLFFSVYRSRLSDPLTYIRMVGHVLGHADWNHLIGNLMMILLVGPLLEEKYGSAFIAEVIVVTAVVTGIAHVIFFPNTMLLGASGVAFAFIILSSFTGSDDGSIPLTFILVAVLYIGDQIYEGIMVSDNVSNLTHILGGVSGGAMGMLLKRLGNKERK